MLPIDRVKPWLIRAGLYRAARWVYRRVANRRGLRQLAEQTALYRTFVKPGDLCFDLGANRGLKAEALLRLGARVVAVEPQPACIAELRERLGHCRRFTCREQAVGAEPGTAVLNVAQCDVLSSLRSDWFGEGGGWHSSIPVAVTTLDALIATYGRPHYCKIDVEGFELEVLRGLSQPLPHLSFEFHLGPGATEATVACLERLAELGAYTATVSRQEAVALEGDWLPAAQFLDRFRSAIAGDATFDYGEIYVRYEIPPDEPRRPPRRALPQMSKIQEAKTPFIQYI